MPVGSLGEYYKGLDDEQKAALQGVVQEMRPSVEAIVQNYTSDQRANEIAILASSHEDRLLKMNLPTIQDDHDVTNLVIDLQHAVERAQNHQPSVDPAVIKTTQTRRMQR